jgi:hypothetical protein
MKTTVARIGACSFLAWGVLGAAAGAQTATPSPLPTPLAFTAHAHANVTVGMGDHSMSGRAVLGVSQRANLTRIDLVSLTSDALTLPQIKVTAVIDRAARTLTVWNDTTKVYRVQRFSAATPTPAPHATATPMPVGAFGGRSPFANLDVLDVSMRLTGHTTTAGLPTTGLVFELHVARKGAKAPTHLSATVQLSDDYGGFPLSIEATAEPDGMQSPTKFSYAVDDLTRTIPAITGFRVPAGYRRAASIGAVIFNGSTFHVGSPSPIPIPTAIPSASPSR